MNKADHGSYMDKLLINSSSMKQLWNNNAPSRDECLSMHRMLSKLERAVV